MNPSWLDTIPAIPLARGVPVIAHGEWSCTTAHPDGGGVWRGYADSGNAYDYTDEEARVDIEDPQGFGYALRHLVQVASPDFPWGRFGGYPWLAQTALGAKLTTELHLFSLAAALDYFYKETA